MTHVRGKTRDRWGIKVDDEEITKKQNIRKYKKIYIVNRVQWQACDIT